MRKFSNEESFIEFLKTKYTDKMVDQILGDCKNFLEKICTENDNIRRENSVLKKENNILKKKVSTFDYDSCFFETI